MVHILHQHRTTLNQVTGTMALDLHPRISRIRRQSAVEQTSDLLKAYLEHLRDPFAPNCDESDEQVSGLMAGFLVPQRRSA